MKQYRTMWLILGVVGLMALRLSFSGCAKKTTSSTVGAAAGGGMK